MFQILVPPIPRNMHPDHNEERRRERAKALQRFENFEDVDYMDAAEYAARDAMTVVAVVRKGYSLTSGTILTSPLEVTEEAAIATAMTSSRAKFSVSGPKTAIRNFAKREDSLEALILVTFKDRRKVQIVWVPADSSLLGNENAHDAARGLTNRAGHIHKRARLTCWDGEGAHGLTQGHN